MWGGAGGRGAGQQEVARPLVQVLVPRPQLQEAVMGQQEADTRPLVLAAADLLHCRLPPPDLPCLVRRLQTPGVSGKVQIVDGPVHYMIEMLLNGQGIYK